MNGIIIRYSFKGERVRGAGGSFLWFSIGMVFGVNFCFCDLWLRIHMDIFGIPYPDPETLI